MYDWSPYRSIVDWPRGTEGVPVDSGVPRRVVFAAQVVEHHCRRLAYAEAVSDAARQIHPLLADVESS